jgi:hypothetical protein
MGVVQASATEDAIWGAVESAMDDGWSPKRFVREVEQAWRELGQERLKAELKEFP